MRIIVSGGGTGGHLFPGIAVAEGMRRRAGDCEVMFIGTGREVDRRALRGRDFRLASVPCRGLKGKGPVQRLSGLALLPGAVLRALWIMRRFRPGLVIGVGGYVTGPVLAAAKLAGIPTCIHEQNSVPGLANRLLARFVDRVFLSLPVDLPGFQGGKCLLLGNPVREELLARAGAGKADDHRPTLLVLGGSQGARRINELMLAAGPRIDAFRDGGWRLIHQTGAGDLDWVRKGYAEAGIKATVGDFFTDMAERYGEADLVLSRAGATTLAELAVMGLPALLVPYPYAADNHQERNAASYVESGAAQAFRQEELSVERLEERIRVLLGEERLRAPMAANMRAMGRPMATEEIVDECLRLIRL